MTVEARAEKSWVHARGFLSIESARVMAIVNATPDSFADGGQLWQGDGPDLERVILRCRQAVAEGASILDVGGESTRPGARPVDPVQEAARVVPIVAALARDPELAEVPVSIDTRRASVAHLALEQGACIVNDISGLADPQMLAVVAAHGAGLVLGHLRGVPQTMQLEIGFSDLLAEVGGELAARVERACQHGLTRAHILADPGIGFGKTAEQSAALVGCA
ncbi:MAG: dihydropteroate synthase, partial [Nannocystaceae bacterium]